MSTERTIALSGQFVRDDTRVAAAAITPGELVEVNSAGAVAAHSTAAGVAAGGFAFENELLGKGIDTDIAAGDQVPVGYFHSGAIVNAFLDVSQTIAAGDALESAGNGNLQARTPFSQSGTSPFAVIPEGHTVGFAEEAVTTTAARLRIKVRVA